MSRIKKFQFTLDTVMEYKQQILDSLTAEYGAAVAQVRQQEAVVDGVLTRYSSTNEEFREKKATGITIAEALSYQMGLQVLEAEIQLAQEKLAALRRAAEAKREQMVAAKQDKASLEKLREKKLDSYNRSLQKSEEQFIDELVSAEWNRDGRMAMGVS